MFDFDIMTAVFPKILNQGGNNDASYIIESFDQNFINFPTILIMLDRVEEAKIFLEKALRICEHFGGLEQAKGRILIMQISMRLLYEQETLLFHNKTIRNDLRLV